MFTLIRLTMVAIFHLFAGLGNLIKGATPKAQNSSTKAKGQAEQGKLVVKYRAPVSASEMKRRQDEANRKAEAGGGPTTSKPAQMKTPGPTPGKKKVEDGGYDLAE